MYAWIYSFEDLNVRHKIFKLKYSYSFIFGTPPWPSDPLSVTVPSSIFKSYRYFPLIQLPFILPMIKVGAGLWRNGKGRMDVRGTVEGGSWKSVTEEWRDGKATVACQKWITVSLSLILARYRENSVTFLSLSLFYYLLMV